MEIAVWIVTVIVALILGASGVSKIARSKEKILEDPRMGWANDFSEPTIKLIGFAEVAGALGLVLPCVLDIVPVLTPAAGFGLAGLMLGAVVVHTRRHEYAAIPIGLLLSSGALFVAIAGTIAL